ncbi:hypothetical protein V2H45_07925 [Tumidithrix elongata RA019]|uniref:Uncharacterized protein n=1 Tax=Tumidithrix elongata BACA0141 TaxID=2716417 RepID=A0AAW9PYH2_9CYAN|nr:hypothetical protein [Tumidithrix elongata RA019]
MTQYHGKKFTLSIASVLLTLIFTPICLSNHKAWAEEIKVTPKKETTLTMFENISLAPHFTPTLKVLHGISGGTVETQKMSGRVETETGACIGFIDAVPDHTITLTKPFKYLELRVKSSGDTVMLIRGPGGSWCSDDVSDRNPVIAGEWLPGKYEVWVGSYEANMSFPYLLELSEVK